MNNLIGQLINDCCFIADENVTEIAENLRLINENSKELKKLFKQMKRKQNITIRDFIITKVIAISNRCFGDIVQELHNIQEIFHNAQTHIVKKND